MKSQNQADYTPKEMAELVNSFESKNKRDIHLLSAQIVHRVKDSQDSVMNLCQVVENLIREANL